MRVARGLVLGATLAVLGCTGGEPRNAPPPDQVRSHETGKEPDQEPAQAREPIKEPNQESKTMSGAASPTGEPHPGEIVHEDKIDGRTWTKQAAEVPQTIAWVDVNGTWQPVVRIEITGTPERRRITKFGSDGAMLETTISAPPRPRPPARKH